MSTIEVPSSVRIIELKLLDTLWQELERQAMELLVDVPTIVRMRLMGVHVGSMNPFAASPMKYPSGPIAPPTSGDPLADMPKMLAMSTAFTGLLKCDTCTAKLRTFDVEENKCPHCQARIFPEKKKEI